MLVESVGSTGDEVVTVCKCRINFCALQVCVCEVLVYLRLLYVLYMYICEVCVCVYWVEIYTIKDLLKAGRVGVRVWIEKVHIVVTFIY